MSKYVCVHGHFYQPPRENPWLEEVEFQESAYPYHDWNARITAECYSPNTAARILDHEGKIKKLVNNYSRISFDFGPTLQSWLERHSAELYKRIIETDKEAQKKFSGHGSAIAQSYNHMIMPLANDRDKKTQVEWGIRDFEYRFSRKPEAMWLSETAVDTRTLEILAEHGIKFTVLGQHQGKRFRKIGEEHWSDTSAGKIDPKMPYLCRLPSGKSIAIFFYDNHLSAEIAFRELIKNGDMMARELSSAFVDNNNGPQLVSVATDGETYGHHHRFGEMGLAYGLDQIELKNISKVTIYGEYLEKHPPSHEVEIFENSSWSCAHGVERWRSNCGCRIGGHLNWNQDWRQPLRSAMDWLRDRLVEIYEKEMSGFAVDPWAVRDDYIEVILDRSKANVSSFISKHSIKELSNTEKVKFLRLLEMQRNAMLMYTSCGWFFDEVSGIETVQIMQYASRAIQLAEEVSSVKLEEQYIKMLEAAPSNIHKLGNAAQAYNLYVKGAKVDLLRVGAHYAASSLFEEYPNNLKMYCYEIESEVYNRNFIGQQKIAVGKAVIRSLITWEEAVISFAAIHFGDHNILCGVNRFTEETAFNKMREEIHAEFSKNNTPVAIQLIDKYFPGMTYTIKDLFKDEQRNIFDQIIEPRLSGIESSFRAVYEQHYPIMQVMKDLNIPLPHTLASTLSAMLNFQLNHSLTNKRIDLEQLQHLAAQVKHWGAEVDKNIVGFVAQTRINELMKKLLEGNIDLHCLKLLRTLLHILQPLSLDLNLWETQNIYFSIGKKYFAKMHRRAEKGDHSARQWIDLFNNLGHSLWIKTPMVFEE